jgi:hypothetical protein
VFKSSDGATRLLGMPGMVAGVQEVIDGEWVIYVETEAVSTGCPECGGGGRGARPAAGAGA